MMSSENPSDAEFDSRYEAYFNRPDIDGWEIRKVNQITIKVYTLH